ncbi:MAG: TMEM165/GDT1 family protein [Leptonema sp. (in: bacteria)]
MDLKTIMVVFWTIFLAELGDKTQLATLLYASDKDKKWIDVFLGSSLALVLTSAIGVLLGGIVSNYISEKVLKIVAGIAFIVVGVWTMFSD